MQPLFIPRFGGEQVHSCHARPQSNEKSASENHMGENKWDLLILNGYNIDTCQLPVTQVSSEDGIGWLPNSKKNQQSNLSVICCCNYWIDNLQWPAFEVDRQISLHDFTFKDARDLVSEKNAAEFFLQALSKTPARTLSLRNYPYTLNDLPIFGRGKVNLAKNDLTRDRERNLPRYNDNCCQLLLEPYATLDKIMDNEEDLELLKSVYKTIQY